MTVSNLQTHLRNAEAKLAAGWRDQAGQSFRNRFIRPIDKELDAFDRNSRLCLYELDRIVAELP